MFSINISVYRFKSHARTIWHLDSTSPSSPYRCGQSFNVCEETILELDKSTLGKLIHDENLCYKNIEEFIKARESVINAYYSNIDPDVVNQAWFTENHQRAIYYFDKKTKDIDLILITSLENGRPMRLRYGNRVNHVPTYYQFENVDKKKSFLLCHKHDLVANTSMYLSSKTISRKGLPKMARLYREQTRERVGHRRSQAIQMNGTDSYTSDSYTRMVNAWSNATIGTYTSQ